MNLINLICLHSFVPLAASLAGPVIVDETAPVPTAPITNSNSMLEPKIIGIKTNGLIKGGNLAICTPTI